MELPRVKKEPEDQSFEFDSWLKENSVENEECRIEHNNVQNGEIRLEDSMPFQKWAESITYTVFKMANRHSELTKKCEDLQKRVLDLTKQNQDLLAKDTERRLENVQVKKEFAEFGIENPINNSSSRQAVEPDNKSTSKSPSNCLNLTVKSALSYTCAGNLLMHPTEQSQQQNPEILTLRNNQPEEVVCATDTKPNIAHAAEMNQKRKLMPNQPLEDTNVVLPKKLRREESPNLVSTNFVASQATTGKFETHPENSGINRSSNEPLGNGNKFRDRDFYCTKRAETTSALRLKEVPLIEVTVKSNCGSLLFDAFPISAVKMALKSSRRNLPAGLNCSSLLQMQQGEILLVKNVYKPSTKKINNYASGFRLGACNTWYHNLLEFKKEGNNQYRFITMYSRYKLLDNIILNDVTHGQDLCAVIFYGDANMEKLVNMDPNKVYVHTATRSEFKSERVKVREMIIVQVHNDYAKQWLVNSAAYQFYTFVKDSCSLFAAPMHHMPHPHNVSLNCDHNYKKQ